MSSRITVDELRGRKVARVALFGVVLVAQVFLFYDWNVSAFRPILFRGHVKRKVGANSSSAATQLDDNTILPNDIDIGTALSALASRLQSTGGVDAHEATTIPPAHAAILDDQEAYSNWSVLLNKIPISPSRFLNERPRGLRLAFVGDSVTRYQAISLMYYLYSGRWFPSDEMPCIVAKDDYDAFAGNETSRDPTWNLYLNYTSHQLGEAEGYHWCDCYRTGGWLSQSFENRYFRDARYDNYVYFITKFGTKAARGRWQPSTISQWDEPRSFGPQFGKAEWEYQWKGIIHRHLARIKPRPTHVVFNEGLWSGSGLSNETLAEIMKALRAHDMRGIYKTTTKRSGNQSPDLFDFDAVGCSLFNPCLDLSWTHVLVGWPYYWDEGTHFTSHVYTLFNQQLFRLLHDLSLNSG